MHKPQNVFERKSPLSKNFLFCTELNHLNSEAFTAFGQCKPERISRTRNAQRWGAKRMSYVTSVQKEGIFLGRGDRFANLYYPRRVCFPELSSSLMCSTRHQHCVNPGTESLAAPGRLGQPRGGSGFSSSLSLIAQRVFAG